MSYVLPHGVQDFKSREEKESLHAIEHKYNGPGAPCVLKALKVSWSVGVCMCVHARVCTRVHACMMCLCVCACEGVSD